MKTQGYFKNQKKGYSKPFNYLERTMSKKFMGGGRVNAPPETRDKVPMSIQDNPDISEFMEDVKKSSSKLTDSEWQKKWDNRPRILTETSRQKEASKEKVVVEKTVVIPDYDAGTRALLIKIESLQSATNAKITRIENSIRQLENKLNQLRPTRSSGQARTTTSSEQRFSEIERSIKELKSNLGQPRETSDSAPRGSKAITANISAFKQKINILANDNAVIRSRLSKLEADRDSFVTELAQIIEEHTDDKASKEDLDTVLSSLGGLENSVAQLSAEFKAAFENLPLEIQKGVKEELKNRVASIISRVFE